jgi:hypothetical protein
MLPPVSGQDPEAPLRDFPSAVFAGLTTDFGLSKVATVTSRPTQSLRMLAAILVMAVLWWSGPRADQGTRTAGTSLEKSAPAEFLFAAPDSSAKTPGTVRSTPPAPATLWRAHPLVRPVRARGDSLRITAAGAPMRLRPGRKLELRI